MPRRRRHLTFSSPPTSQLSIPSSPAIPRTPLTPPLRLHQRTLIPTPPLSPHFLATAPSRPHPWIWRCHVCARSYCLGVTRRCLEDGHYFCSVPSPPATPAGRKSKRRPRGCRAEFDYTGWSNYNIWRREVHRILAERKGLTGAPAIGRWDSEAADVAVPLTPRWKERNCWVDCAFPSECHNYRAALMREKALLAQARQTFLRDADEVDEKEDELFKDVYWSEDEREREVEKDEEGQGELNEDELKSLYLDMVVGSGGEGEVQIKDCDGLGEEGYRLEYTKSKRRNSIEALVLGDEAAVAPVADSPLKGEVGWDWGKEEGNAWEDVGLGEDGEGRRGRSRTPSYGAVGREVKVDDDVQMKEALRSRSMFLRSFDGIDGTEERFGDEDDGN